MGADNKLIHGKKVSIPFQTNESGNYLIEVVAENGIAYINTPYAHGNVWSIISSLSSNTIKAFRKDIEVVRISIAKRINTLRLKQNRDLLSIDEALSRLAQAKVDDMIVRKYQAHRDPDGNYIDGFAKKR